MPDFEVIYGTIKAKPKSNYDIRRALKKDYNYRPRKQPVEIKLPKNIPNPIHVAEITLGKRLTTVKGEWRLDGVPTNLNRMMRACNQVRKDHGLEQIDTNPAWRV